MAIFRLLIFEVIFSIFFQIIFHFCHWLFSAFISWDYVQIFDSFFDFAFFSSDEGRASLSSHFWFSDVGHSPPAASSHFRFDWCRVAASSMLIPMIDTLDTLDWFLLLEGRARHDFFFDFSSRPLILMPVDYVADWCLRRCAFLAFDFSFFGFLRFRGLSPWLRHFDIFCAVFDAEDWLISSTFHADVVFPSMPISFIFISRDVFRKALISLMPAVLRLISFRALSSSSIIIDYFLRFRETFLLSWWLFLLITCVPPLMGP